MKNTVRKTYNKKSYDPFQDGQVMDYCTAKGYIDDAWAMRAKARQAILAYRECGFKGDLLHTSYFCGVLKKTMKDYRRAQRLCVRAYHKCMADTVKSRSQYF